MDLKPWLQTRRLEYARDMSFGAADLAVVDEVASVCRGDASVLGRLVEGLAEVDLAPGPTLVAGSGRRSRGAWMTPTDEVSRVLASIPVTGRVLDPSCGAGAFLVAVVARRRAEGHPRPLEGIAGVDIDPLAVRAAAHALAAVADVSLVEAQGHVRCGDALGADGPSLGSWDLVVGNPPWVDSGTHIRTDPEGRAALHERVALLGGNWDLWCAFVLTATRWAAPGGRVTLLLPNKLLAAPYAATVRRALLMRGTVERCDAADHVDFRASVRPIVLCWTATGGVPEATDEPWPAHEPPSSPPGCRPLGELAWLGDSATVAEAYALRDHLRESSHPTADEIRVVNSGTLDPLTFLWGERPMRYLGRRIAHPVISLDALPRRRREHAMTPKLLVASMTRSLEAAMDADGIWCGAKSTVTVRPRPGVPLVWLAAVLAATRTTAWYRATFGGLALQGGYLRVSARQLSQVPIPPWEETALDEVAAAVRDRDHARIDTLVG